MRRRGIDLAVVVQVAHGQATARCGIWNGGPPSPETSVSRPPAPPMRELRSACERELRASVEAVPVCGQHVEPTIVVHVGKGDPPAHKVATWGGQSDRRGVVSEESSTQIVKEGR